jgi:hypothetical protein
MRNIIYYPALFVLALLLSGSLLIASDDVIPAPATAAEEIPETTAEKQETPFNVFNLGDFLQITAHGDLWLYHISTEDAYHGREDASFTELTARLGADLTFRNADWISAQFRIVGTDVYGKPDNWTAPSREDWATRGDLANITFKTDLGGADTSLTIGLQELCYGDGLLIFDGYSEKRAIWTTPIRSFPAAKLTFSPCDNCSFDFFAAIVDKNRISWETYLGSGIGIEGGGQVYGVNATNKTENFGSIDLGFFAKDEDIRRVDNAGLDSGSNTYALTLRDSYDRGPFNFTGEIVKQWGRTRVVQNSIAVGNPIRDRNAWGGQVTVQYNIDIEDYAPWVKTRYAYFSGDRRSTSAVESFDPFFYGFNDWGTWYQGDMTAYSLTNTNEKVLSVELGMTPTKTTKLRLIYFDFAVARETALVSNHSWANEINLIFDYFPVDWVDDIDFFFGAMLGAVKPESGAKKFNGDDETQTELMVWAGLYF